MTAPDRINLFPAESRARADARGWRRFSQKNPAALRTIAGIVALLCLAAAFKHLSRQIDPAYLQAKISELRSTQEVLSSEIEDKTNALLARKAALLDRRNMLDDQLRALAQPQRSQSALSEILVQLAEVVPETIRVRELRFSNNNLSILGATANAEAVAVLMQRLDDADTFHGTVFRHTQREINEKENITRYSFEIVTTPVPGRAAGDLRWKN